MKTTCAIIIIKDKKMLVVHPTDYPTNVWGFPKGIKEDNESEFEAAVRETGEETGINVLNLKGLWRELGGYYRYKKQKKQIKAFIFTLKEDPPTRYRCITTFTTNYGQEKPEVDNWKWYTYTELVNSDISSPTRRILDDVKDMGLI